MRASIHRYVFLSFCTAVIPKEEIWSAVLIVLCEVTDNSRLSISRKRSIQATRSNHYYSQEKQNMFTQRRQFRKISRKNNLAENKY